MGGILGTDEVKAVCFPFRNGSISCPPMSNFTVASLSCLILFSFLMVFDNNSDSNKKVMHH